MHILFVHQHFPGQFKHLAPALAAHPEHTVVSLSMQRLSVSHWQGVRMASYRPNRQSQYGVHPWLRDLDTKVIRAEGCFQAALQLRAEGFSPDVIIAHPGWGESLFLKHVWPHAKLGLYAELYYLTQGGDVGFDPEFPVRDADSEPCRIDLRNLNWLAHLPQMDGALSPTHWQANTFPEPIRSRIAVIHDGVDTSGIAPNAYATLSLPSGRTLSRADEVVTFASRDLEPCRGFHVFMRALPALLRQRPLAQVLIVGGDGASYGPKPAQGGSWKQKLIDEVRVDIDDADWARVHFLPPLPYSTFISLLQVSRVHVYLTYPFVLSWSILEAMSAGCAIVASDTAPVREVLQEQDNGRLVDFFDHAALIDRVCELLDDPAQRTRLGAQARASVCEHYDLHHICLPRQMDWLSDLRAL